MENVGLALPHIHYNMETDLDEIIRRFARLHLHEENGTGQCPEPRKGNFRVGVKIHKNSRECKNFRSIIFPDNFRWLYGFKKVWFFHCSPPSPPTAVPIRKIQINLGSCKKFIVLFSLTQAQRGYLLRISSDRDDRMGAKIKSQKNPLGFKQNPKKSLHQNLSPKKSHAEFPSYISKNFCIK